MTKKFLIIGGSDAGISAALRARELDSNIGIDMLLTDKYPNFSICGLPFYLSGEVSNWHNLAHRKKSDIEAKDINVLTEHMAEKIDPKAKSVQAVNQTSNANITLKYDKLLIGTGAKSKQPPIKGLDYPGVFFLRWMTDSFAIKNYLEKEQPGSITIIGAGYIGLEMTEAMRKLGLTVNLVEYFPSILNTLDYQLSKIIRSELEDNDVNIYTGTEVTQIKGRDKKLIVHGRDNFAVESDMVLVATGSAPNTTLAKETGISTGIHDAIQVNRKMETNLPDIYAAGDCTETYHNLLKEYRYVPLGTTAHKQGRIAGENVVGGNCKYAGSLATQSVKIFDLVAARTGLKNDEAREEGFEPITTDLDTWDHKVYYPEAQKMHIRISGDRQTQRLLGAQIVGAYGTEVSKRLDILATAIHNEMMIDDLNELDLSYTPPLSSPWDPVQMAAQKWMLEYK